MVFIVLVYGGTDLVNRFPINFKGFNFHRDPRGLPVCVVEVVSSFTRNGLTNVGRGLVRVSQPGRQVGLRNLEKGKSQPYEHVTTSIHGMKQRWIQAQ